MKYIVKYYQEKTKEEKKSIIIITDNIQIAREFAYHHKNMIPGCYPKVYILDFTGTQVEEASLQILKIATKYMIDNQAKRNKNISNNSFYWKLYNGCRVHTIVDEDVKDCLGEIKLALWENACKLIFSRNFTEIARTVQDIYRLSYNHLMQYVRSERNVGDYKHLYIEDINGDIIDVGKGIAQIVKECDILPTIADDDAECEKQLKLRAIVVDVLKTCSPIQKRVTILAAKALSERQIAGKINRSKTTVHYHRMQVQEKAKKMYPNGYILD